MNELRSFVIGYQGYNWITNGPKGIKEKIQVTPLINVKDEVVKNANDLGKIFDKCRLEIKSKHPNIHDLEVMFILEV